MEKERVTSKKVWSKLLKIEHLVTCLATMACVYAVCAVRVTISSTGGKFRAFSNFMELPVLTLAACSYALLLR